MPLPQVYPIPAATDPPFNSIVPLGTFCAAVKCTPARPQLIHTISVTITLPRHLEETDGWAATLRSARCLGFTDKESTVSGWRFALERWFIVRGSPLRFSFLNQTLLSTFSR